MKLLLTLLKLSFAFSVGLVTFILDVLFGSSDAENQTSETSDNFKSNDQTAHLIELDLLSGRK